MGATSDSIKDRQARQPWSVPYSPAVMSAKDHGVPHILASHCALHVAKTAGKLAAVFEALDHRDGGYSGMIGPSDAQLQTIKDMSADLLTEALRFANLFKFDLAAEHERRVAEKNPPPPPPTPQEGPGR